MKERERGGQLWEGNSIKEKNGVYSTIANICQETAEKYCPILPLVVWFCPRGTITCL